jgi:hypothetical protein
MEQENKSVGFQVIKMNTIEAIVKEVNGWHEVLSDRLNKVLFNDTTAQREYIAIVNAMEQNGFSERAIEFYRHAYDSVRTVANLNYNTTN